jgi:hypothetical protein
MILYMFFFLTAFLQVKWDDDVDFRRLNRVSPWEVELTGSVAASHLSTPNSKRLKPCLPYVNLDYLVTRTFVCSGRWTFILSNSVFIVTNAFLLSFARWKWLP